jgi:DNA gyrase/topoisomerase IV subunit A
LVAAGVNAIKLGVGDEVVGAEVVNGLSHGTTDKSGVTEVFLIGSDGRAKRVAIADFPSQGRYGRGVIAWDMPLGVKLAGVATGKPNSMVTIHLLKAAAKSSRLDEAGLKKRAATRGDVVVEVKPGDAVLGLTSAWAVERFMGGSSRQSAPTVDSGKPEQLSLLGAVKEKKRVEKKAANSSSTKKPAESKTPAARTPAKNTPASKTPAEKTPAPKTPAKKTPASKTPATRKPTTKK